MEVDKEDKKTEKVKENNSEEIIKGETSEKTDLLELKKDGYKKWYYFGIVAMVLAFVVPILVLFLSDEIRVFNNKFNLVSTNLTNLASIGDFLTGTTFLLAFSSILFVIATFKIQQVELQQNTQVLIESKEEYEESNRIMAQQLNDSKTYNESMLSRQEVQMFESSFYNLLKLLNDLRNENLNGNNESPRLIYRQVSVLYEDIKKMDRYILNNWFKKFILNNEKLEDCLSDIVLFINLVGESPRMNNKSLKDLIDNNENMFGNEIAFHTGLTYSKVINALKNNEELYENSFFKYLSMNFTSLESEAVKLMFEKSNVTISGRLYSYNNMIVLITSRIVSREDNKDLYFNIFLAQLTKSEIKYLKVASYYNLIPKLQENIREIDYHFMRTEREF